MFKCKVTSGDGGEVATDEWDLLIEDQRKTSPKKETEKPFNKELARIKPTQEEAL